MIAAIFGTMVAAHSASSAIAEVAASEHSASAYRIMAEKVDTRGAASAMAHAVVSSTGIRRMG
jgi:hypothetical protein